MSDLERVPEYVVASRVDEIWFDLSWGEVDINVHEADAQAIIDLLVERDELKAQLKTEPA